MTCCQPKYDKLDQELERICEWTMLDCAQAFLVQNHKSRRDILNLLRDQRMLNLEQKIHHLKKLQAIRKESYQIVINRKKFIHEKLQIMTEAEMEQKHVCYPLY